MPQAVAKFPGLTAYSFLLLVLLWVTEVAFIYNYYESSLVPFVVACGRGGSWSA